MQDLALKEQILDSYGNMASFWTAESRVVDVCTYILMNEN